LVVPRPFPRRRSADLTFKQLVGLGRRPRRARDAARLWSIVARERGISGRDELWSQLDLFPTAEDLDAPEFFLDRRASSDEIDAEDRKSTRLNSSHVKI